MTAAVHSLAGRRFRSHPDLEAVRLDQLPRAKRAAGHEAFYGVLRSASSGETVMAIDVQTAVLFLSLATPGEPSAADAAVARLVCDGVLQVETSDGSFVDGCEGAEELFGDLAAQVPPPSTHPIDRLSREGLDYGARLGSLSGSTVAGRLYRYNTLPRTAAWNTRLSDRDKVEGWLGLATGADRARSLRQAYEARSVNGGDDPWLRWRHRAAHSEAQPRYKIYVSPRTAELPEAFGRVVRLCSDLRVPALKVGRDVLGVLRPDKCLLYVDDADSLTVVARELALELRGCAPQGVPFSAPLDATGLLSWGTDPLAHRALTPLVRGSWRMVVTHHLGQALARHAGLAPERLVAFALYRVRLEGIDPDGWKPAAGW